MLIFSPKQSHHDIWEKIATLHYLPCVKREVDGEDSFSHIAINELSIVFRKKRTGRD